MKRIRNIVFDLGGVLIDLDHHQAVSRFEEIGVKDAKQLLDPYEQKGFFLELAFTFFIWLFGHFYVSL